MAVTVTNACRALLTAIHALGRDRSGSVSMEYGLIGTLVSIAIIGGLSSTTTGLGDKWNHVADTIIAMLR